MSLLPLSLNSCRINIDSRHLTLKTTQRKLLYASITNKVIVSLGISVPSNTLMSKCLWKVVKLLQVVCKRSKSLPVLGRKWWRSIVSSSWWAVVPKVIDANLNIRLKRKLFTLCKNSKRHSNYNGKNNLILQWIAAWLWDNSKLLKRRKV